MTKLRLLALTGIIALMATGCLSTAEVIKAAATDPASVCASVTTVYGTVKVARTNIANGSVSCTQEGLTVKSGSATTQP